MENTTENQENQEQTSNHNEVDNQYEKNLEILKKRIKNIENEDMSENDKGENLSNEFFNFILNILPENKKLTHLIGIISETIKNNSKFAFEIISSFTQSCIFKEKSLKDIGTDISKIINTDKIKGDLDLVFNIVNGFVQGCLIRKPDDIKDIAENFFNLLNTINKDTFGEKEEEVKDKLKPIFSLIVSQYFMNILTNSDNKQLSKEDKKQTEEKLFECYQIFHKEDKEKIASFKDIPLKELLNLQDKFFF